MALLDSDPPDELAQAVAWMGSERDEHEEEVGRRLLAVLDQLNYRAKRRALFELGEVEDGREQLLPLMRARLEREPRGGHRDQLARLVREWEEG